MKPSSNEEDYFAREEIAKKKKMSDEILSRCHQEERQRLKDLHFMHCPKCGMAMHEMVYQGVMIDKCYACGAITLDDGELEKLAGGGVSLIQSLIGVFK